MKIIKNIIGMDFFMSEKLCIFVLSVMTKVKKFKNI